MKNSLKDDIGYFLLSGLIISIFAVIGATFLIAWSHMTPQEKENILIIFMASDH